MNSEREARPLTRKQERLLVNLAIEASRADHPNPERRGCPGAEALGALAHRQVKGDRLGELVDHIADCSPCFREYERLAASIRNRRTVKVGAALMIVVGSALLIHRNVPRHPHPQPQNVESAHQQPPEPTGQATAVAVVVDLRFSAPTRGQATAAANARSSKFPRALLRLRIQLPLGSAEGHYEAALFRGGVLQIPTARATAEFQNRMEVLDVVMDTRSLPPGQYELRLHHAGSTWQRFPILIE